MKHLPIISVVVSVLILGVIVYTNFFAPEEDATAEIEQPQA